MNSSQNHYYDFNEKVGIFFILLTVVVLFLYVFDIVVSVIPEFDKSYYNETADKFINLILFFSVLLLAFHIRYILLKYIYKNNINMNISKWLTLLFTIYYLQYKLNRIPLVENEEKNISENST